MPLQRQRASVPAAGGEWARNIGDEVGHDPLDPRCVPVARLAGTRHIVEQHGGEIGVESVMGESTTFTVRLPLILEGAELIEA